MALRGGSVGCGAMAPELGRMERQRVSSSSTAAPWQTLHKCPCHRDPLLLGGDFQRVNETKRGGDGGGTAGRSPVPNPVTGASQTGSEARNRRSLPSEKMLLYAAIVASTARRRHSYLCPEIAVAPPDHLRRGGGGGRREMLQWEPSFAARTSKPSHVSTFPK